MAGPKRSPVWQYGALWLLRSCSPWWRVVPEVVEKELAEHRAGRPSKLVSFEAASVAESRANSREHRGRAIMVKNYEGLGLSVQDAEKLCSTDTIVSISSQLATARPDLAARHGGPRPIQDKIMFLVSDRDRLCLTTNLARSVNGTTVPYAYGEEDGPAGFCFQFPKGRDGIVEEFAAIVPCWVLMALKLIDLDADLPLGAGGKFLSKDDFRGKKKLNASFAKSIGSGAIILDCLLCVDSDKLTPAQREWVQEEIPRRLGGAEPFRKPPHGWLQDWKGKLYVALENANVKKMKDAFSSFTLLDEVKKALKSYAPDIPGEKLIRVLLEDQQRKLEGQQAYLRRVANRNYREELIARHQQFPGPVFSVRAAAGLDR